MEAWRNLIANVDNVKPKGVKAKVEEHAQLAMMSKRVACINTRCDGYRFCRIQADGAGL